MPTVLAIDAGSSSVKAAVVRAGRIVGQPARATFPTHFEGVRAEVDPGEILRALTRAIADLGPAARRADIIGLVNMSPSWIAMDKRGRAITPVVTHQDRRSVEIAREMLASFGQERFLGLSGNMPFPGSISSTTFAWHRKHAASLMRKADLVGHLSTFLHRQLTGARVTDPSNASFMGLFSTMKPSGWNEELCRLVGI
jgi:xylulokinase